MPHELLNVYTVRSVPGHREFYPHYHSDLEIAYFLSGRGIYSVTGKEYPIESGDIFFFSNNEIHKITYVDENVETVALNIHFPPRLLLMPSALQEAMRKMPDLSRIFLPEKNRLVPNRITREWAGDRYDDILAALLDVGKEAKSTDVGSSLLACNSLIRVLVLTARASLEKSSNEGTLPDCRRTAANSGIAAALTLIDRDFTRDLTLDKLCAAANMSRANFERMFRRMTGTTVSVYIRHRRIDRASELLRTTDQSVLEIALSSGYHNTANFNKSFRLVTGKTPTEFRKAD